ncbi:relaxase/mobilization nuclease domain-containing protein [Streptomyces sp. HPF1205]|uniref:relaxase/mobilization nuclease domain-containing protein n=1 Tax=Streptomyces sp. HPF1205 TaxID=2873262 RepID=UPI001CED3FCC|nr:relaxase/mobilization nuclease domain-containing protein [Streptomyces sp. HPF1205]
MVPKIRRGSHTYGLLVYLYGPGRRDEHADPHLVGSWDGFAPDPGRSTDPKAAMSRLAAGLDLRVKQAGTAAPAQHVWHCSVRIDPGDRHLSDAEWDTVARRLVTAVGLTPEGDGDGCRWIAVRHAEDHIHIVATIVRGDLRRPRMNYDFKKAQAECRTIERELGLRQLKPGDGTAAKKPTSAERFKAERAGRAETPRETLREALRQALAGAADEQEFLTRVRDAGLRIKLRHAPSGDVLGYSVALRGDRNRAGEPVWFAGSTLAPDLSLPKIRNRLSAGAVAVADTPDAMASRPHESAPARQRHRAVGVAERAAVELASDGDEAAALLPSIGELLDAAVQTTPFSTRADLREAARAFERATRSHVRAERADNRALRAAARSIVNAGGALGRGEDGAATAMLLSTLVLATVAAARWHSARGHAQQAEAARQAATHLRSAYHQAVAAPLEALRHQARALPEAQRRTYETLIRAALPRGTGRVIAHDALAATLAQSERRGHDPESLLRKAVAMRELDSAESIDDVLVWRLRRLADLPADPGIGRCPGRPPHQWPGSSPLPATRLPASNQRPPRF